MSVSIQQNIDLANRTTFKIGGLARYFTKVSSEQELEEACKWAKDHGVKVLVLGMGSNVLISDRGFSGLVISMDILGTSYIPVNEDNVEVEVKAGELWDRFVEDTIGRGYSGLECLSGIPGKAGSSAVQNIGAYGQEVCTTIKCVRFFDTVSGKYDYYTNEDCKYAYRSSAFKGDSSKIVTAVSFTLKRTTPLLSYKELIERFKNSSPDLLEVREAVLDLRKSKSMVLDPADPNTLSAGSFFKNPVIDRTTFDSITSSFPNVPNWPQEGDSIKLSAGWLIENSGFPRGYIYKEGKVGLSTKHALALVNLGMASADDIWEFAELIQKRVQETFKVQLDPEVVFVGF